MMGWVAKIGAWIAAIIGRIDFSASEKLAEYKHQIELEEAKSFRNGRITPRYLFKYTIWGMLVITFIVFMLQAMWPSVFGSGLLDAMENFIKIIFRSFMDIFNEI